MNIQLPPRERTTGYRERGLWRDRVIDSWLTEAAELKPGGIAVTSLTGELSYAEADRAANRFAGCLQAHGIRRGDVVSFQLPNWVEALVIHHGIIRAGGVSNPIIPIYRRTEVEFIVTEAKSRILIGPSRYRDFDYESMYTKIAERVDSLEHVWLVDNGDASAQSYTRLMRGTWESGFKPPVRSADDAVLLLYTSGTTTTPKGVIHTHNTLDYENRSTIDFYGLSGSDVIFMPSPVTHITGVLYGLQLPSMLATTAVFQDRWDADKAVNLIHDHRCTFVVAATPFLQGLLASQERGDGRRSSLRVFACGGAAVPPSLIREATEHLGCVVVRTYGSTEYPTLTASNMSDPLEKRATTDGRLIGAAEARIVDEAGAELPVGEAGEILARGPEMFVGYLASDTNAFDADGWFATGDLGVRDELDFISIVGRKKDIIIRKGENISVREIEDLLSAHPKVREVAVVGVEDAVVGERARAVVSLQLGNEFSLSELVAYLDRHAIAKQKYPEELVIVDELPKTASGKIQKFKLRGRLGGRGDLRGTSAPAPPP